MRDLKSFARATDISRRPLALAFSHARLPPLQRHSNMATLNIDRSVEFFLDDGIADEDAFRTSLGVDSWLRVHSEHVLAKNKNALGLRSAERDNGYVALSFAQIHFALLRGPTCAVSNCASKQTWAAKVADGSMLAALKFTSEAYGRPYISHF